MIAVHPSFKMNFGSTFNEQRGCDGQAMQPPIGYPAGFRFVTLVPWVVVSVCGPRKFPVDFMDISLDDDEIGWSIIAGQCSIDRKIEVGGIGVPKRYQSTRNILCSFAPIIDFALFLRSSNFECFIPLAFDDLERGIDIQSEGRQAVYFLNVRQDISSTKCTLDPTTF
jgi:hypothetical protein